MSKKIGVIAEDLSDVDVIQHILSKYIDKCEFAVKKFVGNGCGKLRNKCNSWATQLYNSGCEHILVFHDLDRNNEVKLRKELEKKISINQFPNSLIIIPVEEMEAWLLTDPEAIKKAFGLDKTPKIDSQCESINSPKEYLRNLVWRNGKKRYLNTIHNKKIAEEISILKLKKCNSYCSFDKYIRETICK